jgi:DNA helicase HerA-like ATPase
MSEEGHDLKLPFRMAVSGSTASGKTHFVRTIIGKLLHRGDIRLDDILIFSPTQGLSGDYAMFPTQHVFDNFDQDTMEMILTKQREILKTYGRKRLPNALVIIDDFASEPRFWHSPTINRIAMSGRHLNVSLMLLVQRWKAIPRSTRLNLSDALLFKPMNRSEYDQLAAELSDQRSRDAFRDCMERVWLEPYHYIWLDLRARHNRVGCGVVDLQGDIIRDPVENLTL